MRIIIINASYERIFVELERKNNTNLFFLSSNYPASKDFL